MKLTRRHAAACVLAVLSAGGSAFAQDKYPSKPVTIIVPQAPGGANDAIARIVAQKLGEAHGPTVHRRQQARRRRQHRHRGRRQGQERRLHAAAQPQQRARHQPRRSTRAPASIPSRISSRSRWSPRRATCWWPTTPSRRRTSPNSSPPRRRAPGKFMIASAGNGTLNHLIGEMLEQGRRHRADARAVQGRVCGGDRPGRRPGAGRGAEPAVVDRFIKSGKLKVLGVVNEKRVSRAARRADHRRDDPGLRLDAVVRPVRAGRHAEGHRRAAAGGGGQSARRAGREGQARRRRAASRSRARPSSSPRWSRTTCRSGRKIVKDSGATVD